MENTNVKEMLQTLTDAFAHNTAVRKVYGEPVNAHGKTIITVAQVKQGFGGGFGSGYGKKTEKPDTAPKKDAAEDKPAAGGEGGGMGGGMSVTPVGFIEISESRTRFVRLSGFRQLALGAVAGLVAGLLWHNTPLLNGAKGKKKKKKKDKDKKRKKK